MIAAITKAIGLAIGLAVMFILLAFVCYILGLTVIYIFKSLKREAKGGGKYERHRKP